MSDPNAPPLPTDADAALDAERRHPDPPAEVRAAVFQKVRRSVGLPPIPGGGGGGGVGVAAAIKAASVAPKALIAAMAVAATVTTAVVVRPPPARHALRPPPAVVVRAPVSPSPAPSAVVAPSPAVEVVPEPVAAVVAAPSRRERGDASTDDLVAERALLEDVRDDLARGRLDEAQGALRQHRARFPHAHFAEEREFLMVRVLSARGDDAAASRRREAFRRRYPGSLYLPALDEPARTISP